MGETLMHRTKAISENTPLYVLAWPIFIEILLQMLIGSADTIMISRYSETAVGSISNANSLLNVLTITFNIFAIATGIIVSQYLGAKKKEEIPKVYSLAICINLAFGVLISTIMALFGTSILRLLNVPPALMGDAIAYLKIVGGFVFIQAVFMTIGVIFRSNGLMKPTLFISIGMNLINIVGNYLFLYGGLKGLGLGASGVAISSVVSRVIGLIVVIIVFKRMIGIKISLKDLRPFPKDIFVKMLKVGLPSAGEQISWNFSQVVVTTIVNTIAITSGEYIIMTKSYAGIVCMFAYVYCASVASATQIVVGHLVGAGNEDGANRRLIKSLFPSLGITMGITTGLYFLSPMLFGLFTDNPQIIELGQKIILIDIILEVGRCSNLIVIQSLRAAGDVLFPVIIGLISMWLLNVGGSYLLGIVGGLGLVGVWISMASDECLRGVLVIIRWLRGSWRGKRLTT
jgi:putative MATE family efflux protein